MADFSIKQSTSRPILTDTLTFSDGSSPNLTGATVNFVMRSLNSSSPVVNAAAVVTNFTSPATVSYTFTATDTANFGDYIGQWSVTFADTSTMVFPTIGYIDITVEENLTVSSLPTTIVSLAEAKDYLRIPASDRNHDNNLVRFINATVPVIENVVGPCIPAVFEEWHDGGSDAIRVRHPPVIQLDAVSFYIGPVEYVAYQVGTPAQGSIYSCMLDTNSRVVRRGPGGSVIPFPTGRQAIHVVYTAGRNPIPYNIKQGTLELVREMYQMTQQAGNRPDVDEDILDRVSIGFLMSGRVREYLQPHRRAPSLA